jgi:regulator of protease activity HflC (stomatin/prohibitin superfamily)
MQNRRLPLIIMGVVGFIVLMALSSSLFYTLNPSEEAIIFYKFGDGLDKDNILKQGFHMKAPWNEKIVYDVSEISSAETMDITDKDGLLIHIDVTVRYSPQPEKIGYLHQAFKGDYMERFVIPEARSITRQIMAQFTAEEIYSTKRALVESTIKEETRKKFDANYVTFIDILIRSIKLPDQIRESIQNKLQKQQEALAYQYLLDREKSEAERKRIAAEGESRANNIINNSLTDKLLKMRGIEATLELAKSPNAKVIVVGSGKDGMPLILGNN